MYDSGSCVACGLAWDQTRFGAPGLGEKVARLSLR